MDINLQSLNLQSRWPKLARLQDEAKSLEKRHQEAEMLVQQLQGQIGPARDRDLDAEARAVGAGRNSPEPTHEPEVKKKIRSCYS